jgi:hypothetical protein
MATTQRCIRILASGRRCDRTASSGSLFCEACDLFRGAHRRKPAVKLATKRAVKLAKKPAVKAARSFKRMAK